MADGQVLEALRRDMQAWVGCLAGALAIDAYTALLAEAGFADVGIEITRRYTVIAVVAIDAPIACVVGNSEQCVLGRSVA